MSDGSSSRGWREIVPGPRSWIFVAGVAVTFGLLLMAPRIAEILDGRGVPGDLIALGGILAVAAAVLWTLTTTFPGVRRRRAVMRWARERDAPFRSDFTLPASLREVTSLQGLAIEGGVENLVVLEAGDGEGEVLVFDRWRAAAVGYERAEWRTVAALRAPIDVPRIVVHPRRHRFRMSESDVGLSSLGSESGAFDRRFRLLATSRAAAVALIDPRMMAWLMDGPPGVTYEAAGRWLVCSKRMGRLRDRDMLMRAAAGFREHLPRVSASFYPPEDPGFVGR
jgi:hypothetical protein